MPWTGRMSLLKSVLLHEQAEFNENSTTIVEFQLLVLYRPRERPLQTRHEGSLFPEGAVCTRGRYRISEIRISLVSEFFSNPIEKSVEKNDSSYNPTERLRNFEYNITRGDQLRS